MLITDQKMIDDSLIKSDKLYKYIKINDLFAGSHAIHTPKDLVNEVLSNVPLTPDSKVMAMFNIEFVISLVYNYKVAPQNITFYSDNDCKTAIAEALKVNVVTKLDDNMQFDALVGNPPYDRGIKTDIKLPFTNIGPHAAFSFMSHSLLKPNGVWSFVLPCNFMCLPTGAGFRQWVLNSYELDTINLYDNGNKEVFDINMSDVLVITGRKVSNPDNTAVTWAIPNTAPFAVDMTKYDFWPMYKSAESVNIFDSVMKSKITNLDANANTTPPQYYVSGNLTRLGQRQNPNPQDQFSKGVMKPIGYPIWLGFSTQQELDYQYEWFGTKHYAYILSMLQSTTKNQPILFAMIGEHGFNNSDFDKHFNITASQSVEIEQWHKTVA